jgi:hypothetical protein
MIPAILSEWNLEAFSHQAREYATQIGIDYDVLLFEADPGRPEELVRRSARGRSIGRVREMLGLMD